jgi:hypothetical protein
MRITKSLGVGIGLVLFIVPCLVFAIILYLMGRSSPSNDPGQICVEPGCLQLRHPRDPQAKKRARPSVAIPSDLVKPQPHPTDTGGLEAGDEKRNE